MSAEIPVIHRQTCVVLTVLALAAMATTSQAATKEEYYNLTDHLFQGYKKGLPPAFSGLYPKFVHIAFNLYSIIKVNEQDQTMKTNAMLWIEWYDERLWWKMIDYGNINSILTTQSSVWLPDIVVGNTVTSQTQLGYNELQVRIESYGLLRWEPTEVFETSCDFDVTYYPFDTQVCTIEFNFAMSTEEELTISIKKDNPVDLSRFAADGIWEVVDTSASTGKTQDGRAKISFSLQLKRRSTFYVLNVILPVGFLAMTSFLVFALPATSGEKMSLSIAVLLAFAVFLTVVKDTIPKTSIRVSVLTVYVIQLMGLTTLSVMLSVPLIKLHHRPSDKPLGTKAAKVIAYLRKVMCISVDQRQRKVVEAKTSSQKGGRLSIVNEQKHNTIVPCDNSPSAITIKTSCELSPVSGELASETISMFLFYIFFLYSIVVTVVCVFILITGGASQEESTRLTFNKSFNE